MLDDVSEQLLLNNNDLSWSSISSLNEDSVIVSLSSLHIFILTVVVVVVVSVFLFLFWDFCKSGQKKIEKSEKKKCFAEKILKF